MGNEALRNANAAANANQSATDVGGARQPCPVYDVIVLVSGTVDPVNSDPNKLSNSYDGAAHDPRFKNESGKDSDYYWDGNEHFINPVVAFQKSYDHVYVYDEHSWSGDNCVHNRELAGKLLAEVLCRKIEPDKGLPREYIGRKVSFHFIGHSHGGNVINEVTRHIARLSAWPGDWKVKSVTYLSTPFFQTIHKPNTARFHGGAKICNVWCNYDLTQAAIADFSLRQLTRVTEVVVSAEKTIKPIVDRIVNFDTSALDALKVMPSTKVNWDWLNTSTETKWEMDPTKGRNLYDKVLAMLRDIRLVFQEVKNMVLALNEEITIRISEPLQNKGLRDRRKIIPDAIRDKILGELNAVLAGLAPTVRAFENRIASGVYPVRGFISDIHVDALVRPLLDLLDVNPATLDGKLTRFLFEAFKEQIEVFDDTIHTCKHIYSIPIVPVNVSQHDEYQGRRDPQFFYFKTRLASAERIYLSTKRQVDFLHMLFLLAAQIEDLYLIIKKMESAMNKIGTVLYWWSYVDDSSTFYVNMRALERIGKAWAQIINERAVRMNNLGIEVLVPDRKPKYGSVGYLAMVSHSVSRQKLYPQVDTFLRDQFDSHEVKPQR